MKLPNEFKLGLVIKYGEAGFEIAQYFNFILKYLGYRVLDYSKYDEALELINSKEEIQLKDNETIRNNILTYAPSKYYLVHNILTEKSKKRVNLKLREVVIKEYIKYIIGSEYVILGYQYNQNKFLEPCVKNLINASIYCTFTSIDKLINHEEKTSNENLKNSLMLEYTDNIDVIGLNS